MKVGDLVHMPGSIEPSRGIILRYCKGESKGFTPIGGVERRTISRVEVYWIKESESSWEPVKWLEVINPS